MHLFLMEWWGDRSLKAFLLLWDGDVSDKIIQNHQPLHGTRWDFLISPCYPWWHRKVVRIDPLKKWIEVHLQKGCLSFSMYIGGQIFRTSFVFPFFSKRCKDVLSICPTIYSGSSHHAPFHPQRLGETATKNTKRCSGPPGQKKTPGIERKHYHVLGKLLVAPNRSL